MLLLTVEFYTRKSTFKRPANLVEVRLSILQRHIGSIVAKDFLDSPKLDALAI